MASRAPRFGPIDHVGITTSDLDASIARWVEHLGAERLYTYDLPGGRAAFVRLGESRVEFFAWDDPTRLSDARRDVLGHARLAGVNHVGLDVEDLDATVAALRARRGSPGDGSRRPARTTPNPRRRVMRFLSTIEDLALLLNDRQVGTIKLAISTPHRSGLPR